MSDPGPETTLIEIAGHLRRLGKPFALVGGLAVSIRAEVRFTRDVDLAVGVSADTEMERLVSDLRLAGYEIRAIVEHDVRRRLATARLLASSGQIVDLLAASCGIEREVVERATDVSFPRVGPIPVARAEELLAMKILSMTDDRLQDRLDASNLVVFNEDLDVHAVRDNLEQITVRGYHREQDLSRKLDDLLARTNRRT